MKFLYGRGGANVPVIKDYELLSGANVIQPGEVLKCNSDGKITQGEFDTTIGVAAEYHSGKADILNPRANGNMIKVDITADAVYRADAPTITATSMGTNVTLLTNAYDLSDKIIGSTLVLIKKGDNSSNTDEIGTARKVTGYDCPGSYSAISLEDGGAVDIGDVFMAIPPIGYEGAVAIGYQTISFDTGEGGKMRVVGNNIENGTIDVILLETFFD